MPLKPCLNCGEPSDASRCEECALEIRRAEDRRRGARGQDRAYWTPQWRSLSRRARRIQPFCSDCGATTDLQADHSPEAWRRYYAGKTIRLQDIDVVCGPCNRARGRARPQTPGGGRSPIPADQTGG